MEILSKQTNIDFMSHRRVVLAVSVALVLASLVTLGVRGLNFGLDFTGGTLIEVGYPEPVDLADVRARLADAGFGDAVVQTFGSARDIIVRLAPRGEEAESMEEVDAEVSNEVLAALGTGDTGATMRRVEFVGPQVGEELAEQGGLAMIAALGMILLYIIVRFQWKFSVGAVLALIHDVIIVIGVFAVTRIEFDLTVLAAILAVIGYSLNDTIVVYDRVRENFREMRKGDATSIFNRSINQMLARTLMTSLTTLLVLIALFVFGGEIIHAFALALIVGVVVGTYSSIYVAGTSLLFLDVSKQDLLPAVAKEGADQPNLP